jgi:uncharacterized membrane protein YdjX (TVP38/TMEM64 family)
VRTRDYVLGTALGMLPFTALFIYLGSASTDAVSLIRGEGAQPWHIALLALSAASAFVLTFATSRLARRPRLRPPLALARHA